MSSRGEESFHRPRINVAQMCKKTKERAQVIPERDTSCISLEYRRRAPCAKPLSPKIRGPTCPAKLPEVPSPPPPCRRQTAAVEKRSKKLIRSGRKISHRSVDCSDRTGSDVRVPCGAGIPDHASDSDSHENKAKCPKGQNVGKPCSSDARRNVLKSKLKELLREIEPIPESCLLESMESKPEPEVLAEVLLMSEADGMDFADIKPDNVFETLFSDMSMDHSIEITNAAPESMSDVVVPVKTTGQESSSFDMPNSESIIENVRGEAPPNLNAFKQSNVYYEQFSEHVNELLGRAPPNQDISELLGASNVSKGTSQIEEGENGTLLDYIMRPGPASRINRIHTNGSITPNWFPGFTIVSPFISGYTKTTNDPGEALKEAWRLCHPRHFDDRSRTIVNMG